jgi:TRAP-type C4-dicarboxylate transport system permease small subunit
VFDFTAKEFSLMAKQYKKLQNKVYPKKKAADNKPQEKIGKDYLLLGIIAFMLVITLAGWEYLTSLNRWMYVLLTFSLSMTYVFRHAKISENAKIYVNRASLVAMGLAIAMFLMELYYRYAN